MSYVASHAPLLLGLQLANQNNNREARGQGPAAGTVVPHQQIVEIRCHKVKHLTMSDVVSHAPILLMLLLTNQNNNAGQSPAVGTVVPHRQIVEIQCHKDMMLDFHENNGKNGAIPGTVSVHGQTMEIDFTEASIEDFHDCNGKNGAIPGTVMVQEQTTEVKQSTTDVVNDLGVLRLRGESRAQGLSEAQCKSYATDGYLIIPDAITTDEATNLLNLAHNIMDRVSKGGEGIIRHDVSGDEANTLSPIGRVLATFEPGSPILSSHTSEPPHTNQSPPGDKSAADPFSRRIARLGCGVHKLRPFHSLTHSPFNHSVAHSLGYDDARITQSQLIAKLAGVGGEIVPHQDGCASFTDPPSALTFWYALEDATVENGCLCVAPGSHLMEPLRQRLIKQANGQPNFETLDTPLWAREAAVNRPPAAAAEIVKGDYKYRALEVKAGTLILFHGNLLHKSGANMSEKNRIAYNFNIVDGGARFPENGYMRPADGEYERF
ncbi:MAG: hypothetical protein Q9220_007100 [cf. Caloplaca sp. 1 TL-2023]